MTTTRIHFYTELIRDPHDKERKIEISPLVAPGQLLVSLPDDSSSAEETAKDSPKNEADPPASGFHTLAGNGVELDESSNCLVATQHGYPEIEKQSSGEQLAQVVHVKPLVDVSDDKMEARLQLFPAVEGGKVADAKVIQEALDHQRIIFGVDYQSVEEAVGLLEQSGLPVTDKVVARGRAPIHGKDAFLRFEVVIGPISGKELANGTIDFRERRMFVGVDKGQLIATKVPKCDGHSGMDLMGSDIVADIGKDIQVQVTDDASYDEESGRIVATESGILTVVNDSQVRVSSVLKIDGDVDFSTGNIRSQNAVEITGSVYPDFIVSAKGDLSIGGNIQSAEVGTRGNLVVKGGIMGEKPSVRAMGDADVFYIERGKLQAGGDVVVRSNVYYSDLQISGNLHCPDEAKIIGGRVIVGGSMSVGQIGSDSSDPAYIAVGTHPKRLQRYEEMQREYFQLVEQLQSLTRRFGSVDGGEKKIALKQEEVDELGEELSHLNLIPESPEVSLGEAENFISVAEITVHGSIASRTKVRIGNDTMHLDRQYSKVRLAMNPATGYIEIHDL